MLGFARQRKRWRSGILCLHPLDTCRHAACGATSAAKRVELANGVEGFRREGAKLDFEAVRHDVEEHVASNKWIKREHVGHISDFLAHIVGAAYATPQLCARTPEGYDFLPCAFPHPNMNCRKRTQTAKRVCLTLGPQLQHQIFGLIVWRYHNTDAAWEKLRPILKQFKVDEDIPTMRRRVRAMYGASDKPSFLFSIGDGIRSSGGKGSWRAACLDALDSWWEAAVLAAAILENPQTTPALWHDAFLKKVVPRMPHFGLGYWSKFVFGDIGLLSSKASLEDYTIVGVGCLALLSSWGLQFPRGALARQRAGLEAVRELKKVVAEVFRTARHAGIQMARTQARLEPLSCYDVQVPMGFRACGIASRVAPSLQPHVGGPWSHCLSSASRVAVAPASSLSTHCLLFASKSVLRLEFAYQRRANL